MPPHLIVPQAVIAAWSAALFCHLVRSLVIPPDRLVCNQERDQIILLPHACRSRQMMSSRCCRACSASRAAQLDRVICADRQPPSWFTVRSPTVWNSRRQRRVCANTCRSRPGQETDCRLVIEVDAIHRYPERIRDVIDEMRRRRHRYYNGVSSAIKKITIQNEFAACDRARSIFVIVSDASRPRSTSPAC